jgi:hypothetical protein
MSFFTSLSLEGFCASSSDFLILNCVSTSIPTPKPDPLETLVGVSSFVPKIVPFSILPQNLLEAEFRMDFGSILMVPHCLGDSLQIPLFLAPLLLIPEPFTPEAHSRNDLGFLTVVRPPT